MPLFIDDTSPSGTVERQREIGLEIEHANAFRRKRLRDAYFSVADNDRRKKLIAKRLKLHELIEELDAAENAQVNQPSELPAFSQIEAVQGIRIEEPRR